MLEDLLDERFVLAVWLAADRLGPERAYRRLVDLADVLAAGSVEPAPLNNEDESLRLPAEPDELRLQARFLLFAADVDPAVAESGRAAISGGNVQVRP